MGYGVAEFATEIGLSRKKYEDVEALRDYGCFLDFELLCVISDFVEVGIDSLRLELS